MIKQIILIAVLLLPTTLVLGDEVNTVENVDIEKYMGTWYEIQRIPNSFQKKCIGNVTANYTVKEDGNVRVVNSCLEQDGKTDTAKGLARVLDRETNAKLQVSFVSLFGIYFFWGNYWILYLDEDYQNAVVGDPSKKYGWILSRNSELTPEQLEPIYQALRNNGYDTADFVPTRQNIETE